MVQQSCLPLPEFVAPNMRHIAVHHESCLIRVEMHILLILKGLRESNGSRACAARDSRRMWTPPPTMSMYNKVVQMWVSMVEERG
jgi:hypothetical protein